MTRDSWTATPGFQHLFVEGKREYTMTEEHSWEGCPRKSTSFSMDIHIQSPLCHPTSNIIQIQPILHHLNVCFHLPSSIKLAKFRSMLHLPFWVQSSISKLNLIRHKKFHIPLNLTHLSNCIKPSLAIQTVRIDNRERYKAYIELYLLHPKQL